MPPKESLVSGYTGRMLLALSIGAAGVQLGRQVVPPLLPAIADELAISSAEAGIALTVMSIVVAVSQYPSGVFSDLLSRKTILVVGTALLAGGCVLTAVAPTYYVFLVGVAVLGAGNGIYTPAARANLSDLFSARRGEAFGYHMTSIDIGGVAAAGVAIVALAVSWRLSFVVAIGVVGLATLSLVYWSRESFVVSLALPDVFDTGARLMKQRDVRTALLSYSLFMFVYYGAINFLPTYLHAERGFDPVLASAAFGLFYAVGIPAKLVAGAASDRMSRPLVGVASLGVASIGLLGLLGTTSTVALWASVVAFGVGLKAFFPPLEAYLMDLFPVETMGGDLGATRTVYLGVGSLGPAYVGIIAGRWDYRIAFAGFIAFLVGSGWLLLVPNRNRSG